MGFVKKIFILLFLFGIGATPIFSQEQVEWRPDIALEWSDFRGAVPQGTSAAATTASGISYDFSTYSDGKETKLDVKVYTYFYPDKSWYKPKVANELTLAHEQLHFDITELFARQLRKELRQVKFSKNVKTEVRERYQKTLRQLNDFQNKYDAETDYSRNRTVQQKWIMDIAEKLKS